GHEVDPETGLRKRKQKWITFRGTKKEAEKKLTEQLNAHNKGEFIEPTKLTVGEWLDRWLKEIVKPAKRPSTYEMYELIVRLHLKPALGTILLQALRPGHIQQYHASRSEKHSGATLRLHHAILSGALKSATRQNLVVK